MSRKRTDLAPVHASTPLTSQTNKLAPTEPESAQTTPGDELVREENRFGGINIG